MSGKQRDASLRERAMSGLWFGRIYFVGFVAVLALVLAACGGSDDEEAFGWRRGSANLPADAAPASEQVIKLRLTASRSRLTRSR